jgi:hypothetical protein
MNRLAEQVVPSAREWVSAGTAIAEAAQERRRATDAAIREAARKECLRPAPYRESAREGGAE